MRKKFLLVVVAAGCGVMAAATMTACKKDSDKAAATYKCVCVGATGVADKTNVAEADKGRYHDQPCGDGGVALAKNTGKWSCN